jgi:riboflavin transporter FmnP
MNTKAVGVIIAFTALATVLNYIKIPVPYLPNFTYQMGDIVLIVALLLFGAKPAVTIATLNMLLTIILYQNPAGPIGPPYYLISVLAMFMGIYLAQRTRSWKKTSEKQYAPKSVILSITLGAISRTLIMLPLDYFIYPLLVSLVAGLSAPVAYSIIMAALPSMIIYNITVPIIMVPISYIIATRIAKYNPLTNKKALF